MKRIISALVALCMVMTLAPAALAEEAPQTIYEYIWSQDPGTLTHTATRMDGKTMAYAISDDCFVTVLEAIANDANEDGVGDLTVRFTSDTILVGVPTGEYDVQNVTIEGGHFVWDLNGYTLTLRDLQLGASTDSFVTFRNGTVQMEASEGRELVNASMLYAFHNAQMLLDSVTVSRCDGGELLSAEQGEGETPPVSVIVRNCTLISACEGAGADSKGINALLVTGADASMSLENTQVTGASPVFPIASVTDGTLTLDENSTLTATQDGVAAAIVKNGALYLNGGKLLPGAGGYAFGDRGNGKLYLSGGAVAQTVELRSPGVVIANNGADTYYIGDDVTLRYTGKEPLEDGAVLVSGCADQASAQKFTFEDDTMSSFLERQVDGSYRVVAFTPSSSHGGGGSSSARPTVSAGAGGAAKADGKGNVTITPDKGYRVAKITVNGKTVALPANGVLSNMKSTDKVNVAFEKIPAKTDPALTAAQFADLNAAAWYYEPVGKALELGLMRGTSETVFSPDDPTSRAMFLTVLHRTDGAAAEEPEGGAAWYAASVQWAKAAGLSDGTEPEADITREQLAAILYRYAQTKGFDTQPVDDLRAFRDQPSAWAAEAVRWAVGAEILTGKGSGELDPGGKATRAEMAAMLVRYLNAVEK